MPQLTLPAQVSFCDALKGLEDFVQQASGDEFSLWEASKLRAIADQIERKVHDELERRGISLAGNESPKKLDKPPSSC